MAQEHHDPPSHERFGEAGAIGHASADHEYLGTPPGSGHEHTDARVWIIVKFGAWLLVSAIVIHVGMGFMFALFVQQSEQVEQEFPLAVGQAERLPAEPRLQTIPVNEIYQFRLQEQSVLENYRWIDREAGRVQIPIDRAMRLTVERGLPARPSPEDAGEAAAAPGGLIPADSSSGRTMERRGQ